MNYLRNILVLAVALLSLISSTSAQEVVAEAADTTQVERYFDENAPMFKTQGNKQQKYYIRKVHVRGLEHLDPDLVKASAGLVDGDSILLPSNFISNVISRLWSQRYFSDVKMGAEIEGDSLDLQLFLKERPRVFNWDFEGISTSKEKDIMEKLQLRRNSELSDYVLDKNVKLIKEYWKEKGFRNAQVSYRIEQDSVRAQYANVIFVIDRGERVKIAQINFDGNEVFDDKRLRRTFKKTHQKSINFFKGTRLKDKEYEEDKDLLIDFYNSKGYRNAHILQDSIYECEPNRLAIDLKVSEGNKYYIRDISWVGNSVYTTEQLQNMFAVKKGDTYDKKSMHKRLGIGKEENPEDMSIKSLYQNSGYLMSQIDPAETIVGADSIDLELKIFEGKPFTINEVGITGNVRVDDEVIRRELYTRPGELYDRSMLMQTIRMLGSMGHFNPEAIMPDIKPVSNELVDVNWPLEEQASDQFNIAGGWGSGTFVSSVGITFNNLSLKNAF
ncbi:MAG: outer membrane protein assembly factor BamA, partial [Alistipes sp.]|nr:outer membrane protein assembly factor BamA [Alistipes sp.]